MVYVAAELCKCKHWTIDLCVYLFGNIIIIIIIIIIGDTRKRNCLTHYATNREVAGSIPNEVIGFFISSNPSSRTMALRSTQPLTEMSIMNLPAV
jgi:hypothetical protein